MKRIAPLLALADNQWAAGRERMLNQPKQSGAGARIEKPEAGQQAKPPGSPKRPSKHPGLDARTENFEAGQQAPHVL